MLVKGFYSSTPAYPIRCKGWHVKSSALSASRRTVFRCRTSARWNQTLAALASRSTRDKPSPSKKPKILPSWLTEEGLLENKWAKKLKANLVGVGRTAIFRTGTKHEGETLEEVARTDPNYIKKLVKAKYMRQVMDVLDQPPASIPPDAANANPYFPLTREGWLSGRRAASHLEGDGGPDMLFVRGQHTGRTLAAVVLEVIALEAAAAQAPGRPGFLQKFWQGAAAEEPPTVKEAKAAQKYLRWLLGKHTQDVDWMASLEGREQLRSRPSNPNWPFTEEGFYRALRARMYIVGEGKDAVLNTGKKGKNTGCTVEWVAKNHPTHLEWLVTKPMAKAIQDWLANEQAGTAEQTP